MMKKWLKKGSVALLGAVLLLGTLPATSNAAADARASITASSYYTPIDTGQSFYRTLGPYATESYRIDNTDGKYARAYQLLVSSSASANVYTSSIQISGQGRIHYISMQPGLYVYDIILYPTATAYIDVTNSLPTTNSYVISVY